MHQHRYRAVLFDLDGTLINSFDGIVRLFREALHALGTQAEEHEIRRIIGIPLHDCFAQFVPADQVEKAVQHYRAQYEVLMHDISPAFPGSVELLEGLRAAGVRSGVVSNKRASAVRSILERKGWPLDIIVGEGEGLAPKPAPDMLYHAVASLGLSKHEVLYVGDSPLDADAATAAGIHFAGVTSGELQDFSRWSPVGVFDSLHDLRAFALSPRIARG